MLKPNWNNQWVSLQSFSRCPIPVWQCKIAFVLFLLVREKEIFLILNCLWRGFSFSWCCSRVNNRVSSVLFFQGYSQLELLHTVPIPLLTHCGFNPTVHRSLHISLRFDENALWLKNRLRSITWSRYLHLYLNNNDIGNKENSNLLLTVDSQLYCARCSPKWVFYSMSWWSRVLLTISLRRNNFFVSKKIREIWDVTDARYSNHSFDQKIYSIPDWHTQN